MSLKSNNHTATQLGIGLMATILSLNFSSTAKAATLTPKVFLSGEIVENSAVFSTDTLNFDRAIAEILTTSPSDLETLGNLFITANTIDNPTSPQASLDWNEVANSFSQLRFDAPQWGMEVEPETLPLVAAENIMRGIYDFELPVAITSDNNTFTFDSPFFVSLPTNVSLPKVSVLNAPTSGLNMPSYGGIGSMGLQLPNYGRVSLYSPISVRTAGGGGGGGFNMGRQSIRAEFMQVWQDKIDGRWDLYPDTLSVTMPTAIKGSLPSHINQMEQTFKTEIDISFQLLPQNRFPTAWDLTDDYIKTSPMLNQGYAKARLKVTQDNRKFLRSSAQEATEKLVELQQQPQNRLYKTPKRRKDKRSRHN
ncbi:MAG: hypothetical protein AB4041_18895 [Microcystaceae cyanobacterium]